MHPKYHLYVNYYISEDERRNAENLFCLHENIKCKSIEKICILTDLDVLPEIFHSSKIEIIKLNARPKFSTFFNLTNKIKEKGIRFIIANTDIYFTNDLELLNEMSLSKKIITLTRWDLNIDNSLSFFNKFHSQDVWIYGEHIPEGIGDFHLGQLGCDNRLLQEFYMANFDIKNPSLVVKTIHVHSSGFRPVNSFTENNAVPGKYRYSLPSGLIHPIRLLFASKATRDKQGFNLNFYAYIRYEYYRAISRNQLPQAKFTKRDFYSAYFKKMFYYLLFQIIKRLKLSSWN